LTIVHEIYRRINTPYAPLRKEASGILGGLAHGLGMGVAGHAGTNFLGMKAHHHSNIGEVLAHRGFQHGLLEQRISPVMEQSIKSVFGPESLINYHAAVEAGKHFVTKAPNPDQRRNALLLATQHALPHDMPVLSQLQSAMNHELQGTAPTLNAKGLSASVYGKILDSLTNNPVTGMETKAQAAWKHLKGAGPAAAMVGADVGMSGVPLGALAHFGWNGMRQGAAATDIGQRIAADQIAKGLSGGVPKSTTKWDIGLSPAYLDGQRFGGALRRAIPQVGLKKTPEALASRLSTPVGSRTVTREPGRALETAHDVHKITHNRGVLGQSDPGANPRLQELIVNKMRQAEPAKYKLEPLMDRIVPRWRPQVRTTT
jgi:hypothetical protein